MTPNQFLWAQARDRLVAAVTALGFSAVNHAPKAAAARSFSRTVTVK